MLKIPKTLKKLPGYSSYKNERAGIIFFLGNKGKTRHFHMKLGSLIFLLSSVAVFLLWLPISLGIVFQLVSDRSDLHKHVFFLKKNIFELEDRYEHVFDNAYAIIPKTTTPSANSPVSANSVENKAVVAPINTAATSTTQAPVLAEKAIAKAEPQPVAVVKDAGVNEGKEIFSKPQEGEAKEEFLDIKNFRVLKDESTLEVSFELHNLKKNSSQQGYIWGAAVYKTSSGEEHTVALPGAVKLDKISQAPLNPKKGHRFNLKNFSKATLYSQTLPFSGGEGKLDRIKLGVHTLKRDLILTKVFDVSSQSPQ